MENGVYLMRPDRFNAEPNARRLLSWCSGGESYLSNKHIPHPAHFVPPTSLSYFII